MWTRHACGSRWARPKDELPDLPYSLSFLYHCVLLFLALVINCWISRPNQKGIRWVTAIWGASCFILARKIHGRGSTKLILTSSDDNETRSLIHNKYKLTWRHSTLSLIAISLALALSWFTKSLAASEARESLASRSRASGA